MNKQRFTNRNGRQRRRLTTLASMLGLAFGTILSALPMHAKAAPFDISQVPIDLGGVLQPNLLYIHDDSGSMKWAYLPDSISGNGGIKAARSSAYNKMYYNPDVSYSPPIDDEGNSRGNANFNSAWVNGYALNREADKRNLQTQFLPHWTAYNSQAPAAGAAGWAYYYQYKSTCPVFPVSTSDACYDKVTLELASNEVKQNFANWYSYYRTREFAARAGVSIAFSILSDKARVGYGRINQADLRSIDGKSVRTLERGIRKFQGADRKAFFDWILDYSKINSNGGTPLRRAVDDAGQYYENAAAIGPWSSTPGVAGGGEHLACRRSFTILMTDGGWNLDQASTAGARGNTDGMPGDEITGPNPNPPPPNLSYTYSPSAPYSDARSNILADVAMYYWKRDLRPDLANKVPTTDADPAFWQHMSLFTIGLGATGTPEYSSIGAVKALAAVGTPINWGDPSGDDLTPGKVDDLLHAALNGHGDFFSATTPTAFVDALSKILASIGEGTKFASSVGASSMRASSETMLYQSTYDSELWTGEVTGYKFVPGTGSTADSVVSEWTASSKLSSLAASARNIFTSKGTGGGWAPTTFTWDGLSPEQKGLLSIPPEWQPPSGTPPLTSQDLLAWLRGDGSKEGEGAGKFRKRDGKKLGDIVHAGPVYVGRADHGFSELPGMSDTERAAYTARKSEDTYKNRLKMVYAGANDGMLHAFDASNGEEKFAYVPSTAFEKLIPSAPHGKLATLAAQDYAHKYFVDGPISVSDAFVSGKWRTVLIGSTGAGGRTYFALNVENPGSFGTGNVMWEFTHDELGTAIGQASIVKLESGDWVAIFGNGYNSTSNTARLFVVNLATGTLLKMIDTKVGNAAQPNGLATPAAVDTNANGVVDAVYAGDMQGNMWRFSFKGSEDQWRVSFSNGTAAKPLFKAQDASGKAQPIMTSPTIRRNPYRKGTIVYFGTGQFFEVGDQANLTKQSFYGVFDECGLSFAAPASCGTDTAPGVVSGDAKVVRADLVQQRIEKQKIGETFESGAGPTLVTVTQDIRVITNNPMTPDRNGFYLDLLPPSSAAEGERLISSPNAYFSDRIVFSSFIPNADPCIGEADGWLFELDPFTGGRTNFSVFDLNNDGFFNSSEFTTLGGGGGGDSRVAVNARRLPGGVLPTILSGDNKAVAAMSGKSGPKPVASKPDPDFGRQAWQDIR